MLLVLCAVHRSVHQDEDHRRERRSGCERHRYGTQRQEAPHGLVASIGHLWPSRRSSMMAEARCKWPQLHCSSFIVRMSFRARVGLAGIHRGGASGQEQVHHGPRRQPHGLDVCRERRPGSRSCGRSIARSSGPSWWRGLSLSLSLSLLFLMHCTAAPDIEVCVIGVLHH